MSIHRIIYKVLIISLFITGLNSRTALKFNLLHMLKIEIVFPAESCESTVDVKESFPQSFS